MTAAEHEPLWGVQHASTCCVDSANGARERVQDEAIARLLAREHQIVRNPCRVVTSADGGRSWQPAGEDKP